MFEPKEEIYNALNALGVYCALGREAVFSEVPAITFTIGDNAPRYDLDREIAASDIEVTVDVWAEDLDTLHRIAAKAEAAMRDIDYLCGWSSDIPNPEGALYHYQMRFDGVKV